MTQVIDPSNTVAYGDPGDETQRNFRYQHAYGAIILIAGYSRLEEYSAIWCEHHEDILAERIDNTYDAFQIKTRQPELGYWYLENEDLIKSFRRFVGLYNIFGSSIRSFAFVSNTDFFKCGWDVKEDRLKKSPVRFLEAVKASASLDAVPTLFLNILKTLAIDFNCQEEDLYQVLKKTQFIKGPSREGFDAEISHNHLTKIESCSSMAKEKLNAVRDEIIQQVYKASSLYIDDPRNYLINIGAKTNPRLLSKRVSIDIITQCIQENSDLIFRYQPVDISINISEDFSSTDVLEKKLLRGNLADQLQTMKRRKISSERRLLELSAAEPETFQNLLAQLESVVQAECDEALLEAKTMSSSPDFGPKMLHSVYTRLRDISENKASSVENESYETLVGIAALLSENCSVWWSEKFDLKSIQ